MQNYGILQEIKSFSLLIIHEHLNFKTLIKQGFAMITSKNQSQLPESDWIEGLEVGCYIFHCVLT